MNAVQGAAPRGRRSTASRSSRRGSRCRSWCGSCRCSGRRCAIAKRSPNEFELTLKVESEGGRREELYLRKDVLIGALQPLPAKGRDVFAPLGLDSWVPPMTTAPPPVVAGSAPPMVGSTKPRRPRCRAMARRACGGARRQSGPGRGSTRRRIRSFPRRRARGSSRANDCGRFVRRLTTETSSAGSTGFDTCTENPAYRPPAVLGARVGGERGGGDVPAPLRRHLSHLVDEVVSVLHRHPDVRDDDVRGIVAERSEGLGDAPGHRHARPELLLASP